MIRCSNCGEENPERARFCLTCGTALAGSAPAPKPSRKTVTIVFADVTGSTALGEQLDPESMRSLMSRYFDAARQVMERHGGTVEKFIGDAVMAVFGIPVLHEDDALRAVRAAADLRDAVAGLSESVAAERGIEFSVRIGVNTGEVVVGDPTSGQTMVTGDPVNVAARLEQAAPPGEILLGASTHQLVRDAVTVEATEPLRLKGKTEAVRAHRLISVDPDAAGHARRLDASLVGRERELALLSQALDRAIDERSAYLFTVLGPAGVGKSRLVAEFLAGQRDRATVYRGRCLPYGDGITYWPLREVVREAASITDADAPADAVSKIHALVTGHERADLIAEQIAGAIGLSEAAATPEEVAWAFRKLMESRARESPLVLLVDDIQWAEPTFLDLLEHVADWSRAAPILLLCLARPDLLDARPAWGGGKMNATAILLEPLSDDESRQLVDKLLGSVGLSEELTERVTQAAEGNPLFVEELIAMLVDDGLLQRSDDGGSWQVAGDLSALEVPPSVSALLAARLDRLNEAERDVIGRASVVGKVFEQAAIAELSSARVRPSVQRDLLALVRKELIRPDQSSPDDDVYRFRHLLIRDAAYNALSKEVRADLHERFADWLVSAAGEGRMAYDEIVGYHLEQAYLYCRELNPDSPETDAIGERAIERLTAVGRRAYGRSDVRSAQSIFSSLLPLLKPADARYATVLATLAGIAYFGGELDEAERLFEASRDIADKHGHSGVALRSRIQLEHARGMRDPAYDWSRLEAMLDAAQPVFEKAGDQLGLAHVWDLRAELRLIECQWTSVIEAQERALAAAEAIGDDHIRRTSLMSLCTAWWMGPTPVPEALEKVRAVAEDEGRVIRLQPAQMVIGVMLVMAGHVEDGLQAMRAGRAALGELGMELFRAATAMQIGEALTMAGQYDEAIAEMREGAETLERMGEKGMLSTLAGQLGIAVARVGQLDDAERNAFLARDATTAGDVMTQIVWRQALALVASGRGDHGRAEQLATAAIEFATRTDSPNARADAGALLADVLVAGGKAKAAGEVRREALALYEAKGNLTSAARIREALGLPSPPRA
ncbi:MAG: adenylate/guanylate cyclase domain-containing protein [Chloroflexota bacterium]